MSDKGKDPAPPEKLAAERLERHGPKIDLFKLPIAKTEDPHDAWLPVQLPDFLEPHDALRYLLSSPNVASVHFQRHPYRGVIMQKGQQQVECIASLFNGQRAAILAQTPEEAAYGVYRFLRGHKYL
jgi:hypothetical protein